MQVSEQFADKEYAKVYSQCRKEISSLLAEKIIFCLKEKYDGPLDLALDVGCGSGQGTVILAPFFKKVYGLDRSQAQIQEAKLARSRLNVTYKIASAETLAFPDNSVQLVTASAALHWFRMDAFFSEVRRVLCNNGILAVYAYHGIKPLLDDAAQTARVVDLFSEVRGLLEPWFPSNHKTVMEKYENVNFPFEEVQRIPDVRETFDGQLSDVIGTFRSFSGLENLRKKDELKAEEILSHFQSRLEEIVMACNIPVNETMKLYRDYFLIICRKI